MMVLFVYDLILFIVVSWYLLVLLGLMFVIVSDGLLVFVFDSFLLYFLKLIIL